MSEIDPIKAVEEPLDVLQARWSAVLEELRLRKALTTSALASCATPARVEGDVLVLQFGLPALRGLFERGPHRAALAAAIAAVVGQQYRIALETVPPAGERLRCAQCGSAQVVPCGVEKDRNPEGRWVSGKIARVYFQCENGHAFTVEFGAHDGGTFTRTVIGPTLE